MKVGTAIEATSHQYSVVVLLYHSQDTVRCLQN